MSFFMNPFDSDFRGNLLLGDRQYTMTFVVKSNLPNSSQSMMAWNPEPFNVSTNKNLTVNYSFDQGKSWTALVVDVSASAANTSAALAFEIVNALNANSTFSALFTASVNSDNKGTNYVLIKSIRPKVNFKVYVSNGGAESVLRFNKKAGVAEIPTYFARHTIANVNNFPDSVGMLIQLDTAQATDQQVITEAGLNYHVVQADWQLLKGRSGLFNFQNVTLDDSKRVTQIIEYPAGAVAGDLAKKTQYGYANSDTQPNKITEIPYTLTNSDLVTP